MKLRPETYTLPAYWASYLINGDASGISEHDKAQCDAWLAYERSGAASLNVVSCEPGTIYSRSHDAEPFTGPTLAECAKYNVLLSLWTIADARKALAPFGMTLSRVAGEYRVRRKGSPAGEGYYTPDLADAVNTARRMATQA